MAAKSTFLGQALRKYDLEDLDNFDISTRKLQHMQDKVQVKRGDGSVAKCRGQEVFHGAFTGGFSAGYFNSVDTKDGWAPSTFVSSRAKRRNTGKQRVEDFMDDEDRESGLAPPLVTRPEYQGSSSAGAVSGRVLDEIIQPDTTALRQKLLAASGVRPIKRVFGVTMRPGTNNGREVAEWHVDVLFEPKVNAQGVGFEGRTSAVSSSSKMRLGPDLAPDTRGHAHFGTGVFDQEDVGDFEDVYCSKSSVIVIEDDNEAKPRGELAFTDGGVLRVSIRDAWRPSPPPSGYTGRLSESPYDSGADILDQLRSFFSQNKCDPLERAEILRAPHRGYGKPTVPPQENVGEPLWRADAAVKSQILEQLGGSRFVVGGTQDMDGEKMREELLFPRDAAKQARYDRFCDALEGRAAPKECMEDHDMIGAAVMKLELEEFGRVYKKYGGRMKIAKKSATPATSAKVLQRGVNNWRPCAVLCARFNVPDPWAKRQFVDDRTYKPEKATAAPRTKKRSAAAGSTIRFPVRSADIVTAKRPPPRPPIEIFKAIFEPVKT